MIIILLLREFTPRWHKVCTNANCKRYNLFTVTHVDTITCVIFYYAGHAAGMVPIIPCTGIMADTAGHTARLTRDRFAPEPGAATLSIRRFPCRAAMPPQPPSCGAVAEVPNWQYSAVSCRRRTLL